MHWSVVIGHHKNVIVSAEKENKNVHRAGVCNVICERIATVIQFIDNNNNNKMSSQSNETCSLDFLILYFF